jgi:biopolymer transport protein ExbB/TolQ
MKTHIKRFLALTLLTIGFGISNPALAEGEKTPTKTESAVAAPNSGGAATPQTAPDITGDATAPGTAGDAAAPGTEPALGPDGKPLPVDAADVPVQPEPKFEKIKPEDTEAAAEEAPVEEHEDHFTIEKMWEASGVPVKIVLVFLLVMLLACCAVAGERLWMLSAAKRQSQELGFRVAKALKDNNTQAAIEIANSPKYSKSYLGRLLQGGLKEFSARPDENGIEAVERALEKNSIGENESLRKGLTILATTGATAPFVGLVGTIFGIINAFQQMGEDGGSDLTTLAPAIGEALITTAFGIMVALVGVWLFNFFTSMIERITNDMTMYAQDLLDWCHKRVLPPTDQAAK